MEACEPSDSVISGMTLLTRSPRASPFVPFAAGILVRVEELLNECLVAATRIYRTSSEHSRPPPERRMSLDLSWHRILMSQFLNGRNESYYQAQRLNFEGSKVFVDMQRSHASCKDNMPHDVTCHKTQAGSDPPHLDPIEQRLSYCILGTDQFSTDLHGIAWLDSQNSNEIIQ